MSRSYEYLGYTLEVSVEVDFLMAQGKRNCSEPGYVAVVRVFKSGTSIALISPLRFGESGGRPFANEADAIMGGFSAGRKIVDDLFSSR
ncbi:hypothetical protein E1N52_33595 [Paraburkholderia guartelaensis]|uniref:Uncharacterized protein n=1 Tax=Paraburkholderia guartelaensis TaxID=2546446 RepID=A0A4V2ZV47_9BURK|nr:hypothetical protein [Paraburkholderia guartelaensis]TDG03713.1 hypothetical protein E1N52_33595 [Paraburkholderia guartelaensis]